MMGWSCCLGYHGLWGGGSIRLNGRSGIDELMPGANGQQARLNGRSS